MTADIHEEDLFSLRRDDRVLYDVESFLPMPTGAAGSRLLPEQRARATVQRKETTLLEDQDARAVDVSTGKEPEIKARASERPKRKVGRPAFGDVGPLTVNEYSDFSMGVEAVAATSHLTVRYVSNA